MHADLLEYRLRQHRQGTAAEVIHVQNSLRCETTEEENALAPDVIMHALDYVCDVNVLSLLEQR